MQCRAPSWPPRRPPCQPPYRPSYWPLCRPPYQPPCQPPSRPYSWPPRRPPWQLPRWPPRQPPRRSPSLSPCRHSHIKLWCVLDGVKTWRTEQPTDKAILGVGYRVILLTGPVGIQCALPKSCQESCSYHTNHSWNMLNRFLCNMCRCGIQCAIPKRCQKSCSLPHPSQL